MVKDQKSGEGRSVIPQGGHPPMMRVFCEGHTPLQSFLGHGKDCGVHSKCNRMIPSREVTEVK